MHDPIQTRTPYTGYSHVRPFEATLTAPGKPTVRKRVCAYESASDDRATQDGGYIFSVRF